jgi:hypothetical protein
LFRVKEAMPRTSAWVLLSVLSAATLGGCAEYSDYAIPHGSGGSAQRTANAKKIPLPDRALLETQPAPDCEARAMQRGDKERRVDAAAFVKPAIPDDASADPNADLAFRIKLEYERECYRQAERRVRDQLKALQTSTTQTIDAVKRAEQTR